MTNYKSRHTRKHASLSSTQEEAQYRQLVECMRKANAGAEGAKRDDQKAQPAMRLNQLKRNIAGGFEDGICDQEDHHADCVFVVGDVVGLHEGVARVDVYDFGISFRRQLLDEA